MEKFKAMITPKEKALELYKKFRNEYPVLAANVKAKKCALIAVDEILNNFGTKTNGQAFYTEYKAVEYYEEVKTEIEKL